MTQRLKPKPAKAAPTAPRKKAAKSTRMGRLREANVDVSSAFYQEKRKAIVDMAALTFQEHGYANTTIAMIAEKLGADRASIYYYFGSKEQLFREIVREVAQKAVESAEAIASRDSPAKVKLTQAFESVMETYSSSYPYMHVFLQENFPSFSQTEDDWITEARDWGRRYYVAIRKIIQQGVDEGSFNLMLPVGVTTMGVLGTVNWAHRWYKPGGTLSPANIGEGFAGMLLDGLTGRGAKRGKARPKKARLSAKG